MHSVATYFVKGGEFLIPEQVGANFKKIWLTIADCADRTFVGVKAECYQPRGDKEKYLGLRWSFINPNPREILRTLIFAALCFVPGGYLLTLPYHTLRFYMGLLLTIKVSLVLLGAVRSWMQGNTLEKALNILIKYTTCQNNWGNLPVASSAWITHIQDRNFKLIDPEAPLAKTSNAVARIGHQYLLFKFKHEEDGVAKTFIKAYYIDDAWFKIGIVRDGILKTFFKSFSWSATWFKNEVVRNGTPSQNYKDGTFVLDICSLMKGKEEIPLLKQALKDYKDSEAAHLTSDDKLSEEAAAIVFL